MNELGRDEVRELVEELITKHLPGRLEAWDDEVPRSVRATAYHGAFRFDVDPVDRYHGRARDQVFHVSVRVRELSYVDEVPEP